jgi:FMN phosphatase YigB (HAD superfamily)
VIFDFFLNKEVQMKKIFHPSCFLKILSPKAFFIFSVLCFSLLSKYSINANAEKSETKTLQTTTGKIEALATSDMNVVAKKVRELSKIYGAQNVLVVFDIDNTILAGKDELGSDQWFSWQEKLLAEPSIKDEERSKYLLSTDFGFLLRAQGALFQTGSMRIAGPPEKTKQLFKQIKNQGSPMFALTSRGPEFAYVTIRELLKNSLSFDHKANDSFKVIRRFFYPSPAYNPETVSRDYQFSEEEVQKFKLTKSRNAYFVDGVFYTSGLHKGAMLRIFLKESGLQPKAIIFVDDKDYHNTRMQDAFKNLPFHLVTFHYQAEDNAVEQFHKAPKQKIHDLWLKFNREIYPLVEVPKI